MTLEGEVAEDVATGGSDTAIVDIGDIALPETADAEHGAELFETFQPDAGFACSTCHFNDSENRLIGPGLLNIGTRAATRVEGLTDVEYIFTSM